MNRTHKKTPQRVLATALVQIIVVGGILVGATNSTLAQSKRSKLVWLFRLEGTFGAELPVKITPEEKGEGAGFTLAGVTLEADQRIALTRVRSSLTLANDESARKITEAEWRLDIYDGSLRTMSNRVLQSEKVKIYAGETGKASANFGAVLPDRMVVLLQLTRVSFDDGTSWLAAFQCTLEGDLQTVSCKSR